MSTHQLSPKQVAMARKSLHFILQGVTSVGNGPISIAVGCDEATICRMRPEKFEQFAQILAFLGLKIVPSEMRCFNEKDVAAYMHMASRYMEFINGVDQLVEE
jgi:hypothetical protein